MTDQEAEIARLKALAEQLRDEAIRLHKVIGWARGEFGSLQLGAEAAADSRLADAARAAYERMESVLADPAHRDLLWMADPHSGDFAPRPIG